MLDAHLNQTEAELARDIARLRTEVAAVRRDVDKLLSFLLNATRARVTERDSERGQD